MAADRSGMEGLLNNILDLKSKQDMDSLSFLNFLCLVNLMGLIELIGEEPDKIQSKKTGDLLLPFGRVPVNKG